MNWLPKKDSSGPKSAGGEKEGGEEVGEGIKENPHAGDPPHRKKKA